MTLTRRLLGEYYNKGWQKYDYQNSDDRKDYDIDRDRGHRYDYDEYHSNHDYRNKLYDQGWNKAGYYGERQSGWNKDDKRGYESYKESAVYSANTGGGPDNNLRLIDPEATQDNDKDNGLPSRYGHGYYHYYKRDYHKNDHYHDRYWVIQGGEAVNNDIESNGESDSNLNADNQINVDNEVDNGNKQNDAEFDGDNGIESRGGRYGRNNYYGYNGYYKYKHDDDDGSYWSTQGGNPNDKNSDLRLIDPEMTADRDNGLPSGYGHGYYNYHKEDYRRNDWYKQLQPKYHYKRYDEYLSNVAGKYEGEDYGDDEQEINNDIDLNNDNQVNIDIKAGNNNNIDVDNEININNYVDNDSGQYHTQQRYDDEPSASRYGGGKYKNGGYKQQYDSKSHGGYSANERGNIDKGEGNIKVDIEVHTDNSGRSNNNSEDVMVDVKINNDN